MGLLNRSECKKLALGVAEVRSSKFTRVSKKFLDDLEMRLDTIIRDSVRRHPSVGKTLTDIR
jgi:hypothetical protein